MKNIILFGAPGSGKGTQGEKLIGKYGLIQISTGDLLRKEISQQTHIGIQIKDTLAMGKMVSDDIIFKMIENMIVANSASNGFIFDGFPRNQTQLNTLEKIFSTQNIEITHVLSLQVPDEELVKRILKRGKTNNRIDDQNEIIIKGRIRLYNHETQTVSKFYKQQSKFFEIDGLPEPEKVFENIVNVLEAE